MSCGSGFRVGSKVWVSTLHSPKCQPVVVAATSVKFHLLALLPSGFCCFVALNGVTGIFRVQVWGLGFMMGLFWILACCGECSSCGSYPGWDA